MVGDELRPGGAFAVLLFHAVVVFSVMHSCRGQSEVLGPSQPIVALVGTDVVLPCSLRPAVDASDMTVEWTRSNLNPKFVLVWRDGVELESKKHQSFRDRTSLFFDELKQGNVSLKLSSVKLSDQGTYRCFAPELGRDATIELVVGAASSPVIQMSNNSNSGEGDGDGGVVVLQCESAGWYPEPDVLWLDAEGNLLSAGPPEILRGPDDLYTVSSRVTVDKRHSNNFTCRVQQNNISQSREDHIHVPVLTDLSTPGSSSSSAIIIGLIVAFVVIVVVVVSVFVWKWRQRRLKNKKHPNDEEMLREKKKKKDPSTEPLMEKGRDGETAEDKDMERRPALHPQTHDETQQIQTNQGEREEGEGITERNCLDNRKEETETDHGRENTDNKMEEEPEMENNQQTEGEKTTQGRGDEMESQRLMGEGKHGEELKDEEKEKLKKETESQLEGRGDRETVEDEDTERRPELHPQTQDETHRIQTNQGEREEGEGITERNCLDNRKEETETDHGRENTDNKMEEEPETENNQQTEEGEKTTQCGGDEMESQRLMDEGKDGEEPLNVEDKEKRKKKTKTKMKKKKKREIQTKEAEVQNVEGERKPGEELMDKEKETLKTKLQAKEREEKKWEENRSRKKSQIENKEKQINELSQQLEEVEREMESVKREEDEMEKETLREEDETVKPPLETKKDLEKKKSELQKDLEKMKREKERMEKDESVMIERRKKATNEKEEIIRKLEEMEKQRNEGENQSDSDEEL